MRVKGELNIALTDDAKMTNGPNRNGPQYLVLLVIERLRWRDHDRFAGVNTHRVQVFHVADGYAIVAAVANQLVFDLLPAAKILLGQHLLHAPGERPPSASSSSASARTTPLPLPPKAYPARSITGKPIS